MFLSVGKMSPTLGAVFPTSIPFPCQFRQNEIELYQDEKQDRVNEFQFRCREKLFRQYEMNFYGGYEFRSCKTDSLFCKVELNVGEFQFCSGGIDIQFRWKRYRDPFWRSFPFK